MVMLLIYPAWVTITSELQSVIYLQIDNLIVLTQRRNILHKAHKYVYMQFIFPSYNTITLPSLMQDVRIRCKQLLASWLYVTGSWKTYLLGFSKKTYICTVCMYLTFLAHFSVWYIRAPRKRSFGCETSQQEGLIVAISKFAKKNHLNIVKIFDVYIVN